MNSKKKGELNKLNEARERGKYLLLLQLVARTWASPPTPATPWCIFWSNMAPKTVQPTISSDENTAPRVESHGGSIEIRFRVCRAWGAAPTFPKIFLG
jgi:hypothetical protein